MRGRAFGSAEDELARLVYAGGGAGLRCMLALAHGWHGRLTYILSAAIRARICPRDVPFALDDYQEERSVAVLP